MPSTDGTSSNDDISHRASSCILLHSVTCCSFIPIQLVNSIGKTFTATMLFKNVSWSHRYSWNKQCCENTMKKILFWSSFVRKFNRSYVSSECNENSSGMDRHLSWENCWWRNDWAKWMEMRHATFYLMNSVTCYVQLLLAAEVVSQLKYTSILKQS